MVSAACGASPVDDPVAAHYAARPEAVPAWVRALPWSRVVSMADYPGAADERLAAAQRTLADQGGGVVFFPAGVYRFDHDIRYCSGRSAVAFCGDGVYGGISVTSGTTENISIHDNRYSGEGTRHIEVSDLSWVTGPNENLEPRLPAAPTKE
jgi:hypothetical protein